MLLDVNMSVQERTRFSEICVWKLTRKIYRKIVSSMDRNNTSDNARLVQSKRHRGQMALGIRDT